METFLIVYSTETGDVTASINVTGAPISHVRKMQDSALLNMDSKKFNTEVIESTTAPENIEL